MNKYNEIEIKTAENLLKEGYKWIVRDTYGKIYAYKDKLRKNYDKNNSHDAWQYNGDYYLICTIIVPIFQNITCVDKAPVSLESIVHPQILDDAEKRYLKGVIRPFRDRVQYIKKIDCACEEYIQIQLNSDWTILPHFRTGTMYKGMKSDHGYTLEELGL